MPPTLDCVSLLKAPGTTHGHLAPVQDQVRAIKDALSPWAAGHMYLNLADDSSSAAPFWTEQADERLRRIKESVDPDDLIRSNHPVSAAA